MTADSDVFYGFVFEGRTIRPNAWKKRRVRCSRSLSSGELRRVNEALLTRLAEAKERTAEIRRRLLDDPAVSVLVNTLVLANTAWIITVIARNIKSRPHLHGTSIEEQYSTALTGGGTSAA